MKVRVAVSPVFREETSELMAMVGLMSLTVTALPVLSAGEELAPGFQFDAAAML